MRVPRSLSLGSNLLLLGVGDGMVSLGVDVCDGEHTAAVIEENVLIVEIVKSQRMATYSSQVKKLQV